MCLCGLLHLLSCQLALLGKQLLLGFLLAALSAEICLSALQSCQLLLHIPVGNRYIALAADTAGRSSNSGLHDLVVSFNQLARLFFLFIIASSC